MRRRLAFSGEAVELALGIVNDARDVAQWPYALQSLVKEHGVVLVFCEGINALGYPPTWAQTPKECSKVIERVKTVIQHKGKENES